MGSKIYMMVDIDVLIIETNKDDSSFTVYLKNFEKEDIRTLKCKIEERLFSKII